MRFIHTADWQIGASFSRIEHEQKRNIVRRARLEAVNGIATAVVESGAEFVVVAGDLFDSRSADNHAVSAACAAIGRLKVPVLVIPGNHDSAGPGSVWEREFFLHEREALAPNLIVLLEPEPYELDSAVILPCPLKHSRVYQDPAAWLRASGIYESLPAEKPRVVLAHGSTQSFGDAWEDEEGYTRSSNLIELESLPQDQVDYIALGDWHGVKQVGPKAWYAGTPEPDRFPRGADHEAGNVLVVEARRGEVPQVKKVHTGKLNWLALAFDFVRDEDVFLLEQRLVDLVGQRTDQDLLMLSLSGVLGLEARGDLERLLERLEARLLRLKLVDRTVTVPSPEEEEALARSASDPLIARVAARLVEFARTGDDRQAAVARVALRELYAAWRQEGRG